MDKSFVNIEYLISRNTFTMIIKTSNYFLIGCFLLALTACNKIENIHNTKMQKGFHTATSTKQQHFALTITTEQNQRLPIGQLHNWIIVVIDQKKQPVTNAAFSISGGMPAHGHGLPTSPIVTKHLGSGKYLMEGVKFNMSGEWVMQIFISTPATKDIATMEFNVEY